MASGRKDTFTDHYGVVQKIGESEKHRQGCSGFDILETCPTLNDIC